MAHWYPFPPSAISHLRLAYGRSGQGRHAVWLSLFCPLCIFMYLFQLKLKFPRPSSLFKKCISLLHSGHSYLQFSEDRMILYAGEEDPHGIGSVIQIGDTSSVEVAGELIDVCL